MTQGIKRIPRARAGALLVWLVAWTALLAQIESADVRIDGMT